MQLNHRILYNLLKLNLYTSSKTFLLLVLVIILFNSCKNNKDDNLITYNTSDISDLELKQSIRDSVLISFILPPNEWAPMVNNHNYLPSQRLRFRNNTNQVDTVAQKISVGVYHIMTYSSASVDEKGDFIDHTNFMLIKPDMDEIELKIDDSYRLVDFKPSNLMSIDSIASAYHDIDFSGPEYNDDQRFSLYKNVHLKYDSNTHADDIEHLYNDLKFYSLLARREPASPELWKFFQDYNNNLITGGISRGLNFHIVKHYGKRIDSLLELKLFNDDLQLKFAQGSVALLSNPEFQNKSEYNALKTWLKQTDLYKEEKQIQKIIEPLSNDKFQRLFQNAISTSGLSIAQQLNNQKPYYLLDFWATWCAPCIEGVKTMKQMDMPDNVQVVSISVDKDKDHEKWEKMTKELGQEVSFRMSDTNKTNQEFLKFIEVRFIPRYILMDKDFNLIDQAFYHPQEQQFLPKLKDVENHKRW
jgi:thiol-disulfide isomerase/thioredoxin